MTRLPADWKTIIFEEACDYLPKTGRKAGEGLVQGKYKFFTSSQIQSKYLDGYDFEGEHLIFGTGGMPSIHHCDERFSTSTDCFVVKLSDQGLFPKFVYYFFKGNMGVLERGFRGAGLKHLSRSYLNSVNIPKPPLETQKKTVAILEKAEKLVELREDADQLTDESLKAVFYEMFGDPVKNTKKLPRKKLSDFGKWQSGGTPSRSKPTYFDGAIPWYSSGELNSLFVSDSLEKITEDAIKESAAKIIPPNSLLLGMYDTAALKSSISTVNCSSNQAIAFSQLENNNTNIFYVYFAIQIGRKFFMSRQRGVRQKNLNLSMIEDIEIPCPSLDAQNRFARIVEHVEKLKQSQFHSKTNIHQLLNSLMQHAFKGELIC